MRIVAIIQARMGSTRLPGKVMKDLRGQTVLARVVARVRSAREVGEVVIATTHRPEDDVIVDECRRLAVRVFRGEVNDVLDRYYQAAKQERAEAIVRITSDCPLIEPVDNGRDHQSLSRTAAGLCQQRASTHLPSRSRHGNHDLGGARPLLAAG